MKILTKFNVELLKTLNKFNVDIIKESNRNSCLPIQYSFEEYTSQQKSNAMDVLSFFPVILNLPFQLKLADNEYANCKLIEQTECNLEITLIA